MYAKFMNIKTPEDLLEFMKKNGKYAFTLKKEGEIFFSDNGILEDTVYYLQKPEEMIENMRGLCWEYAELARFWFSSKDFEYKVFFIYFIKDDDRDLPSHTFLVYKKDGKYVWFEYAFASQRGIHEFNSLNELLKTVLNKQMGYAMKYRGAVEEDFKFLKVFEYGIPPYGCTDNKFINFIYQNGKEIFLENEDD